MDSILIDQLEWLISGNMEGLRFKRQVVLLAGCLADGQMPGEIQEEIEKLCLRISREEVFSALMEGLNAHLRAPSKEGDARLDIGALLTQVDLARTALNECPPVNLALLVDWILRRARDRKLVSKMRGHR